MAHREACPQNVELVHHVWCHLRDGLQGFSLLTLPAEKLCLAEVFLHPQLSGVLSPRVPNLCACCCRPFVKRPIVNKDDLSGPVVDTLHVCRGCRQNKVKSPRAQGFLFRNTCAYCRPAPSGICTGGYASGPFIVEAPHQPRLLGTPATVRFSPLSETADDQKL